MIPAAMRPSLAVWRLIFLTALLLWPATFAFRLIAAQKKPGDSGSNPGLPWIARILAASVAFADVVTIYQLLTSLSFITDHGISWSMPPLPPK